MGGVEMRLEQQVVSLELSKQLKAKGILKEEELEAKSEI